MLRQIRLENFKCISKASVDIGKITVLIGPNGVGKSSIGQALMLLRQSSGKSVLITDGELIKLGEFSNLIRKNSESGRIGIGVTVDQQKMLLLGIRNDAMYSYDVSFTPGVNSVNVMVGDEKETFLQFNAIGTEVQSMKPSELIWPLADGGQIIFNFNVQLVIGGPLTLSIQSRTGISSGGARGIMTTLNSDLLRLDKVLSNITFVPPIRGFDVDSYDLLGASKGDFTPGQNKELSTTFLYADSKIRNNVAEWCESITGNKVSPRVIPGKKVLVESYGEQDGIPICLDGFGTNQLVQMLLAIAMARKEGLVIIEEPEIHLHPRSQENLCQILVKQANEESKQLIVTTHSEHILYALVNAVKDKRLTKEDLSIYYFEEKTMEPRKVEVDEYGDIYDWGKNFFKS